jgi:hypothetical protein
MLMEPPGSIFHPYRASGNWPLLTSKLAAKLIMLEAFPHDRERMASFDRLDQLAEVPVEQGTDRKLRLFAGACCRHQKNRIRRLWPAAVRARSRRSSAAFGSEIWMDGPVRVLMNLFPNDFIQWCRFDPSSFSNAASFEAFCSDPTTNSDVHEDWRLEPPTLFHCIHGLDQPFRGIAQPK